MNILHVYDDGDSMATHYVGMLSAAVGNAAIMRSATTQGAFKRMADELHPDIIHVHGAPNFSFPPGSRLVVTPHGQPLLQTRAYVVVARSETERDSLALKHERLEIVRNPIITRTTTPDICARQMLRIYQRIMDSNVLPLMNVETRHLLSTLLAVSCYGSSQWADTPTTLSSVNFRQLYIYAFFEGVLPLVQEGLRILGIEAPAKEPSESYLPANFKQPEPIGSSDLMALITDIRQNGPSLLRLAEVAKALHNDDLDERSLLGQLNAQSQQPFFASILQLLSEQLLLTEGFMPCQPADDHDAQLLRLSLTRRQDPLA